MRKKLSELFKVLPLKLLAKVFIIVFILTFATGFFVLSKVLTVDEIPNPYPDSTSQDYSYREDDINFGVVTSIEPAVAGTCILNITEPEMLIAYGRMYYGSNVSIHMLLPSVCGNASVGSCLLGNPNPPRIYFGECKVNSNDVRDEFELSL